MILGELPLIVLSSIGSGVVTGAVTVGALRVHIEWLRAVTDQNRESISHVQEQQRSIVRELERIEGNAMRAHQRIDEQRGSK